MSDYYYNFNLKVTTTHFDVMVDTKEKYGYFEHHQYGDGMGGGLWFDTLPDGTLDLLDYDGVPSLPREVADTLRSLGITVDAIFYD